MRCDELMSSPVVTVKPSTPLSEVAKVMRDRDVGFVPVCDNAGRVLGVVTDRDIAVRACAVGLSPALTSAGAVMTADVIACGADDEVQVAERKMIDHAVARILVVDDAGRAAGVVSLADVAQVLDSDSARTLRAIAGRDAHPHG
jgi:CBS domain-containing protein